jgi:hypothetical protein
MRRAASAALSVLVAAALTACSSTQDVLEPSAITPPATTAPAGPGTTTAQAPQNLAAVSSARIQFAPIVGTSVNAATALSERLAARARERGMALTRSGDTTTTHVLKGYFTPLTEGKETTVIYVWDVYDPAGSRVHRISGQQKTPAGGKEGWDSVSPETMRSVAEATIDQLAAWLAGKPG